MEEPPQDGRSSGPVRGERLDSWKEIASYLERDVTTVQRWEKREGLPVHRHQHDKLATVYAFKFELDGWSRSRRQKAQDEPADAASGEAGVRASANTGETMADPHPGEHDVPGKRDGRRWGTPAALLAVGLTLALAALWWRGGSEPSGIVNRFAQAKFHRLTDFDGIEQSAAISADGRFIAFLSDRDGAMDVWVTQFGSRQVYNLTRGRFAEVVNPSIRCLGFSPDGALVTFWARGGDGSAAADISIWAVPVLGGDPRLYLEGAAEVGWSRDGSRVAYHTPGPGDPMFVSTSLHERPARPLFEAAAGVHAHFPQWSPDGTFIYLAQGSPPGAMDLWRIKADGGAAERITHHDARVSHPVFLDDHTLAYLATDQDGAGPWMYAVDVERRVPQRISREFDRYTSLAASADGRRVVATLADPKVTLWRLRLGPETPGTAVPISLPTGRGISPRLGPGYLLYVSPGEMGDSVWRVSDGGAAEVWSEPGARVIGGPEIAGDGRRFVMSVQQRGRTLLYTMDVDGTNSRVISSAWELRGAPNWAADGQSIVSAVDVDGTPQVTRIAPDGTATPLIREYSVGPAASPSGDLLVYTGSDIGPTLAVGAVNRAGGVQAIPELTLTRGARRLRFLREGLTIVALLGTMRHKDVWQIDLATGARRALTRLPPDFDVQDFDVSPDGREIVVQRIQEHADIVVIDVPGATARR